MKVFPVHTTFQSASQLVRGNFLTNMQIMAIKCALKKKRHKYLSETNWRIHDETAHTHTHNVNALGLIPLITLSRHSWGRRAPCETVEQLSA